LIGRRPLLVAGTVLFAASSLAAGLANAEGVLIGARLAQGIGFCPARAPAGSS
jgi:MFS family permease